MNWLGDPNAVGIATTVGYLASAAACIWAAQQIPAAIVGRSGHRRFWGLLAAVELVLGVNKQADLQTSLTQLLRQWARQEGWYEHRRPLQIAFSVAACAVTVWLLCWVVKQIGRWPLPFHLAWVALGLQFLYVMLRIASFHHVDSVFRLELGHMRLAWIIELLGVGLCLVAAWSVRFSRSVDPAV